MRWRRRAPEAAGSSSCPARRASARPRSCGTSRARARTARASSADTAWSYRDARWATVCAGVDPDPANADAIRDWTVDYFDALHPHSAGGAYVNMMMDDEGEDRVRAGYRDNYDRLAEIKAAYDPGNLFRVNQNIAPASRA
jgi:FAD/FMN-containing dehydrogenase